MARAILTLGGLLWTFVGLAGTAVAAFASGALLSMLPPLAIDADALGGAVISVAFAATTVGAFHLVILVGLRRGRRWAMSAGVLLCSVLAVAFLALAATAAASAIRESAAWVALGSSGVMAGLVAIGYMLAAVRLVRALRSGSAF